MSTATLFLPWVSKFIRPNLLSAVTEVTMKVRNKAQRSNCALWYFPQLSGLSSNLPASSLPQPCFNIWCAELQWLNILLDHKRKHDYEAKWLSGATDSTGHHGSFAWSKWNSKKKWQIWRVGLQMTLSWRRLGQHTPGPGLDCLNHSGLCI